MRKIAVILAAALAVAACQTTGIARPDASKLRCADEPAVPGDALGVVTDEQGARYMKDLRGAGQDCRSAVEWLRDWFAALPD
jgi:predicted small secreted protein